MAGIDREESGTFWLDGSWCIRGVASEMEAEGAKAFGSNLELVFPRYKEAVTLEKDPLNHLRV